MSHERITGSSTGSSVGRATNRDKGWGDASTRLIINQVAVEAASRAGFEVCAIEVVRPEGLLEFVAIHGDDESLDRLGDASVLDNTLAALEDGTTYGGFTFVRGEDMRPSTRAGLTGTCVLPEVPDSEDPGDWNAWDMLVGQVRDQRGDLRALVYLDVPVGLRRPDPDQVRALDDLLEIPLASLLTVIEREEYAHHIRLIGATRRILGRRGTRTDVRTLLNEARAALMPALSADALEIHLFDDETDGDVLDLRTTPAQRDALVAAARRGWDAQHVVIIESEGVWNDRELARSWGDQLTTALEKADYGAVVVAPVGVDQIALGMLVLARRPAARRWTDGEGAAVLELGHDLGRTLANTYAAQREVALLDELRNLEESRAKFISVITHEINNPMTIIAANAEMLQESPDIAQRDRERAAAILRGTARLSAFVQDLSMLSHLTNTDRNGAREAVDVGVVAEQIVGSMQAVAQRSGVTLELEVRDAGLVVQGSRRELVGAIGNVVDNAVKYSDSPGSVHAVLSRDGDEVLVACTDRGIGISAEDLPQVFRPMFRSTNTDAQRRPGTGLGLGIVQEIVKRHDGRVGVESEPGVGTTFRLWFPLRSDGFLG